MGSVYLSLGSNLDHPIAQVMQGSHAIAQHPALHVTACSRLYRSAPEGPVQDQPDFINRVIHLSTAWSPLQLLDWCQQLEHQHHRQRILRFGPRTLDIDLLTYDQQDLHTPRLTLPHPRLWERLFVLVPWQEIAPHSVAPDGSSLAAWIARLPPARRLVPVPSMDYPETKGSLV